MAASLAGNQAAGLCNQAAGLCNQTVLCHQACKQVGLQMMGLRLTEFHHPVVLYKKYRKFVNYFPAHNLSRKILLSS